MWIDNKFGDNEIAIVEGQCQLKFFNAMGTLAQKIMGIQSIRKKKKSNLRNLKEIPMTKVWLLQTLLNEYLLHDF